MEYVYSRAQQQKQWLYFWNGLVSRCCTLSWIKKIFNNAVFWKVLDCYNLKCTELCKNHSRKSLITSTQFFISFPVGPILFYDLLDNVFVQCLWVSCRNGLLLNYSTFWTKDMDILLHNYYNQDRGTQYWNYTIT